MNVETPRRAWYREPYVWLVAGIPLSAMLVSAVLITAALRSEDGLVADDYYKQGLEINRVLARDEAAARRGLGAVVTLDRAAGRFAVGLQADPGVALPDRVGVTFSHATRAGFDRHATLDHAGDGRYEGALPDLAPGHWEVLIEADDWRLVERLDSR